MRTLFVATIIVQVLTLPACGFSPSALEAEQTKNGIPPTTVASTNNTESTATTADAGLGTIVYSDQTRKNCTRRTRPGSRIHQSGCEADATSNGASIEIVESLTRAPINQRRVAK